MNLAIVGATGLVGQTFLKVLEEYGMTFDKIKLIASKNSVGKTLTVFGRQTKVLQLDDASFDGIDFALFSAGAAISRQYALLAANKGVFVVDNSSCWRMERFVPLVVPEINFADIGRAKLIANPNCSTITAVLALNALKKFGIKSVRYTTFQAVSGAGKRGLDDLENCLKGFSPKFFPYDISKTCIPQIDTFLTDGFTREESKMIEETKKILHMPHLPVSATCVRVPVPNGHAVAVNAVLKTAFSLEEIKQAMQNQSGLTIADDTKNGVYPLQSSCNGSDSVFVGRIRKDTAAKNGIMFFCTADNLRKGAASNAVQILKKHMETVKK